MPKVHLPHASNARVSGSRPGRTGNIKRAKQILIRLTDEEFAAIQAAADAADSAMANWARAVLLASAHQRRPQPSVRMGPIQIMRSRRGGVIIN